MSQARLSWWDASNGAQRRGDLRGERRADISRRQERTVGPVRPLRAVQHPRVARNPERVWGWYLWRHYLVADVEPNAGTAPSPPGRTTPRSASSPRTSTTCTSAPGASPVHHLHGSLFEFRCARCDMPYTGDTARDGGTGAGGGAADLRLRRPDPARHRVVRRAAARRSRGSSAVEATEAADVMVVVGTSAHRLPGGRAARVGAVARRGRHRGQSRAHAAVQKRHDQHPRDGRARRCPDCCSGCPPC